MALPTLSTRLQGITGAVHIEILNLEGTPLWLRFGTGAITVHTNAMATIWGAVALAKGRRYSLISGSLIFAGKHDAEALLQAKRSVFISFRFNK